MEVSQMQKEVDNWISKYGVRYFNELTNLGLLMEEVGELARVITRKYGEQSSKESDLQVNLREEMADVLFVLTCLANQCGVNLEEAFTENIRKKSERDQNRHFENDKLNPGKKE
ncbi:MAG TPA: pyrophosphatase [Flavobacteriales bacterium]|nr:pyrophosphatase [Flavobacteriales bacterium]